MEKRHFSQVTFAGACGLLLPPPLADDLGWMPWVNAPPSKAFDDIEKPKKLFAEDRAALTIALQSWNGYRVQHRPMQYAEVLSRYFDLQLLAEVLPFAWEEAKMRRWGQSRGPELRPTLLTRALQNPAECCGGGRGAQAVLFGSHELAVLDGGPSDEEIMAEAARRIPVGGA